MKYIKDYARTKHKIIVRNEEDYEALVPLLNTVFNGWRDGKFESYCDGKSAFYIDLYCDSVTTRHDSENEILEASDFLHQKEEIVNNYSIY